MNGKVIVATACMRVEFDKRKNLAKYMNFIDEATGKGAKLIVLPEQSLQGYFYSGVAMDMESVRYQHNNAEVVPEGESTQVLIRKAKEKDIHIIWGMTEKDRNCIDVLYNSAVLVGPQGHIGTFRKVHLPADELHFYFPGGEWPVFETPLGKIGILICYDKAFPEAARELVLGGADMLVMPTAWTMLSPDADHSTDIMVHLYDLFDYTRAAENQTWFISSNMIGQVEKSQHNFLGNSRIVAPDGKAVADTGYKEGLAVAEIDIQKGIQQSRCFDVLGLNFVKDRQPQTYKRISNIRHPREIYVRSEPM